MALLNTFDGVADVYNEITPLRGVRAKFDIRPLGKRSKWWERIIKISDTKYVLSDGWWGGCHTSYTDEQYQTSLKNVVETGPIIWERKPDGDYLTIKSCAFNSFSSSRYYFISHMTPFGMRHGWRGNGVHWIEHNGTKHLLPKYEQAIVPQNGGPTQIKSDDQCLVFKVTEVNGKPHYEKVSREFKRSVPVVNRELTKKYNPMIREYWEFVRVTLPVFGDTLREQRANATQALFDTSYMYRWHDNMKPEKLRAMLEDPETYAEDRLHLAILIVFTANVVGWNDRFIDEGDKSWVKFKNFIHQIGDMKTTKEVSLGE